MRVENKPSKSGQAKLMKYGMIACCSIMLLPVAGFFIAGGTIGGLWSNSAAFLPILICVGAHFVMHKVMGKSCHSDKKDDEQVKAIPLSTENLAEKTLSQQY